MGVGNGALQVVNPKGKEYFKVEESSLDEILKQKVANRKVIIISIVGCRGSGKSFLLNVFIKYLQNYGRNDWLDVSNGQISGFGWGEISSKGLLLWKEPFFVKMPHTNEEVCILLIDSQGYSPDVEICPAFMRIFALTARLSSVQILVVDDLRPLSIRFLETCLKGCERNNFQTCLKGCERNNFQKIYILVQNWNEQNEYDNGFEGGRKYMDKAFEIVTGMSAGSRLTKLYIVNSLKDRHCFLMPHPGAHVQSRRFKGCLSDNGISPVFKSNLKSFTEHVLCPENLVVKEIKGNQVTGEQLFEYFKTYTEEVNNLDTIESTYPGMAENILARTDAKLLYRLEMNKTCGTVLEMKPYLSPKSIEDCHNLSFQKALQRYRKVRCSKKLYGCDSIEENFLEQEILTIYNSYKKNNWEKNAARPVLLSFTYLVICALCFFLNKFEICNDSYALILSNTVMYGSLFCLSVWAYCKFTGTKKQVERVLQCNSWLFWNI